MKISYDHEVDALYILFKDTTVTTKHLAEGIAADYDAQGRLAGIEILDAMKQLDEPTHSARLSSRILLLPDAQGEAPARVGCSDEGGASIANDALRSSAHPARADLE
jgi:YD repeat-containing protein